jgi:NADH:ubiquinone oxidoreductase subunit 6 (subunit J)
VSEVFFFLAAIGAIVGAVGVATLRNAFYAVLALVCHLIALAALFLLLRAEFVAAAQVVVYAGAVMVLYVFVVAYVGNATEPLMVMSKPLRTLTVAFALALFAVLAIAIVGSGLKLLDTEGAGYALQTGDAARDQFGTPGQIGELLLTRFLLPFELASFLLLVAAVGAVTLARRRGGLETDAELQMLTPLDVVRPRGLGTMAEGVGAPAKELPATTAAEAPEQSLEELRT